MKTTKLVLSLTLVFFLLFTTSCCLQGSGDSCCKTKKECAVKSDCETECKMCTADKKCDKCASKGECKTDCAMCTPDKKCDKCASKGECMMGNSDKLVLLWSSDDPMVAKRVALMYSHAAKQNGWFKEVTLVIWGPSAKLIAGNVELQNKLKAMEKDGVIIRACIACATEYGVTDKLKKLGYDVLPMGVPLTDYLKKGYKVLTF